MASSEDPRSNQGSDRDVHAVGVFRPPVDDDGRARPAPDRQPGTAHLGRDAARRAVVGALVVGVVGAVVLAVVVAALTDVRGPALVTTIVGGAAFFGAIGALWGAFSRMGRGDDWREAVSVDQRPAATGDEHAQRPTTAAAAADELESRGATEVHVMDDRPSPRHDDHVDRP
jgi:hypothetical protein